MPNPRYQPIEVERHGGRRVVVILDRFTRREVKVYRRGRSFFRWDAHDLRVRNAALRRVAREALEGGIS